MKRDEDKELDDLINALNGLEVDEVELDITTDELVEMGMKKNHGKRITQDMITDLKIGLNTTEDVLDFLELC